MSTGPVPGPQRPHSFRDWLDSRTGYRTGVRALLDEQIPAGVSWWFVTGSVVLFLLVLQFLTGVILAMYYTPSPEVAYDSIRFITERLTFGRLLRGLHVFGASFIVVAAVIHMLRVVAFGSYQKPREVTWLTGIALLLAVFVFALTGYLLPWDQKAYWATTVTINIARSTPVAGEWIATLLRGGADLGALTLLRWYAAHVFLLPAALVVLVVAHLVLMRRHGISGPVRPVAGAAQTFYPHHALKDTLAMAAVFSALVTLSVAFPPQLDPIADPLDASYVPRPEWYFLALFQLLKYFPGPLEPVATIVIPGLVIAALLLLPFLDRGPERHPLKRPAVTGGVALLLVGVSTLTYLGLQDATAESTSPDQSLMAIAGRQFAQAAGCPQCHRPGGVANAIGSTRPRRDPEWLAGHVVDPEVIAPGIRPAPAGSLNEGQVRAILSYLRVLRAGTTIPAVGSEVETAARVFARACNFCHQMDGSGETVGPDLTHIGLKRDAQWLREWISDPRGVDAAASMPAFGGRLSPADIDAIATYLSRRK